MFSSKFLISVLSMWALAWMLLYCDASFDSETEWGEKRRKKTESEESAAAAASLRSAWHLQQNTGRMEWWKVEGRMKAEATALKEWNHHSERGTTGGKKAQKNKGRVAEQIVRNMRRSILKTSAHFLIKALKMPTLCFLFLFCRIPGHEV